MPKDLRTDSAPEATDATAAGIARRTLIQGLAVSTCMAATQLLAPAANADPAPGTRSSNPEPGDNLTFMSGARKGEIVKPGDVQIGQPPVLVYPMDPVTKTTFGSRVNLILLVRVKDSDLSPLTKEHSAEGIVAYSAICTHFGCPITTLHESQHMIVCNCHGSTFDVGNDGAVAHGPAVRKLAMLPVAITDGALVVAGKLDGPIGPPAT
jgi:Rieske Fe-S protein